MANEILSVKLYELDKQFAKLHSRIELSETENTEQLTEEIKALQKECREGQLTLQKQLKYSRAKTVRNISEAYDKIEDIISDMQKSIGDPMSDKWKEKISEDDMVLLAEYSLDFAMLVANNALLISMEALDLQLKK